MTLPPPLRPCSHPLSAHFTSDVVFVYHQLFAVLSSDVARIRTDPPRTQPRNFGAPKNVLEPEDNLRIQMQGMQREEVRDLVNSDINRRLGRRFGLWFAVVVFFCVFFPPAPFRGHCR